MKFQFNCVKNKKKLSKMHEKLLKMIQNFQFGNFSNNFACRLLA